MIKNIIPDGLVYIMCLKIYKSLRKKKRVGVNGSPDVNWSSSTMLKPLRGNYDMHDMHGLLTVEFLK